MLYFNIKKGIDIMPYSDFEISKIYEDAALDIARFIGVLRSYQEKFEYISSQTMDNADPACDVSECLEKLGGLLSSVTIYGNEYKEEAKKSLIKATEEK